MASCQSSIRVNILLKHAASRKIFMGAPSYAEGWASTLKTGQALAVIEGNANTV